MSDSFWTVIGVIAFFSFIVFTSLNTYSKDQEPKSTVKYEIVDTKEEADYNNSQREPDTFQGYECTSDCSGHEAGYEWAEDNEICDPYYDGGNSQSFDEGVRAWAEDYCY